MRSALGAGGIQVVSTLAAALLFVLAARELGPADLAGMATALALSYVLADVVDFGRSQLALRLRASDSAESLRVQCDVMVTKVWALPFVFVVLFTALALVGHPDARLALAGAAESAVFGLLMTAGMSLRADERLASLSSCQLLGRISALLAAVALRPDAPEAFVVCIAAGDLLALVCVELLAPTSLKIFRLPRFVADLKLSRQFGIASLSTDIHNLDTPVAIAALGSGAAGLYSVGNRLVAPVLTAGGQLSTLIFVRVSANGYVSAKAMIWRLMAMCWLGGIMAATGFGLVGEDVLQVVFGPAFQDAYLPTILMLLATGMGLANSLASATLLASDCGRFVARLSVIYGVASLALLYVLGLSFGVVGAAASLLVGQAAFSVVALRGVRALRD